MVINKNIMLKKLKLSNTLTGQKEFFEPLKADHVKMYVCGITPYDNPHLGHGRVYVTFDVLYRLLKFLNYKVLYARNFTDVDDKIIDKSKRELGSESKFRQIAQTYITAFENNLEKLNCLRPDFEPRVTENIENIIDFTKELILKDHAYQADSDVYFSVKSFKDYGKLSKRNLEELLQGARVEVRSEKHNPLDFALWKHFEDLATWDSPWGKGRPGWHIECSAMAKRYLGEQIDIHGGGMDLIFPHHENEIAQSESFTDKEFSKFWVHNAFITIDKEKMSKSLGNFVTLNDVFEAIDPMILRYYYQTHHYRIPIDFSQEALTAAGKAYKRLCNLFKDVKETNFEIKDFQEDEITKKILEFLLDDMNLPGIFGVIFDNLKEIHENAELAQKIKFILQNVLGLTLIPKIEEIEITPEIQKLINEREFARQEKNWKRADEIRGQLKALGVDVQDKKL